MEQFESIVKPEEHTAKLPMLNERLNVLHETGTILLKVCFNDYLIEKRIFSFFLFVNVN